MAQNFRTAFNGFHKEDVVRYLEYSNTKHQNQINQLNTEIEELRSRVTEHAPAVQDPALLEKCQRLESENQQLQEQKEALERRCAQLSALLEQKETPVSIGVSDWESRELDAYRQAERIQKEAQDRAELIYFQANHVLTETTTRVEGAAADMTQLTDQVMQQITQLQVAVSSGKQALQEAASVLATIRPNR